MPFDPTFPFQGTGDPQLHPLASSQTRKRSRHGTIDPDRATDRQAAVRANYHGHRRGALRPEGNADARTNSPPTAATERSRDRRFNCELIIGKHRAGQLDDTFNTQPEPVPLTWSPRIFRSLKRARCSFASTVPPLNPISSAASVWLSPSTVLSSRTSDNHQGSRPISTKT